MKYNINDLTLQQRLGQMIILGLDVSVIDDNIFKLLKEYHIGGVVLYKKNYHDTSSMIDLINKLKTNNSSPIPMFIALDQENGLVNRFPTDIKRLPSPKKQAINNIVNECNELTINILKQLGINMNLAPVLDIERPHTSHANCTRSYSSNYQKVIKYGQMTIQKYQTSGIISVGKHFPGHGLAKGDSHFVLPIIKDLNTLEQEELQVFKTLNKELDILMTSHLRIKGFGLKPTMMNQKIIAKYLKDYQGLLITDDIRMNYLRYLYGTKKVFLDCLKAGNNIIMIKYSHNSSKILKRILNSVSKKTELEDCLNISVQKILNIKEKYHLNNEPIKNNLNLSEINEQITKLSNN